MAKAIQELSVDSSLLYETLKKLNPGETIRYADLNETIDRDVQSEAVGNLRTARRMALNDGIVTAAVRNVGIKRLTDEENALTSGDEAIKRVRSASTSGLKKLAKVSDFAGLSNDAKISHNVSVSVLGAFRQATKPAKLKKIEQNAEFSKISLSRTLELFK